MIKAEFRQARIANRRILTAISRDEAAALRRLARGGDVLEVGSAYGFSAILMARAGAKVVTIDSHEGVNADSLATLDANVRACGVAERVFPMTGRSIAALGLLLRSGARFDGVFVDGGAEDTATDAACGWALLRPGGWLARHDYREERSGLVARDLDTLFPDGPDEVVRTLWVKRKPSP